VERQVARLKAEVERLKAGLGWDLEIPTAPHRMGVGDFRLRGTKRKDFNCCNVTGAEQVMFFDSFVSFLESAESFAMPRL
jgi:hypothetical protein